MRRPRPLGAVRIHICIPGDTWYRVAHYAKLHNLTEEMAVNDLLSFGLHGEGIFLDDPPTDTPPAD